jgi:hypothetical protein
MVVLTVHHPKNCSGDRGTCADGYNPFLVAVGDKLADGGTLALGFNGVMVGVGVGTFALGFGVGFGVGLGFDGVLVAVGVGGGAVTVGEAAVVVAADGSASAVNGVVATAGATDGELMPNP